MCDTDGIPLIGDRFPEFKVKTTHGMKDLPGDYKGKWLVLFSHPADFTPVCTTEFVAFAKRDDKFKAMNAELIGLSIDQVFSHIKWVEWIEENLEIKISFPIIADDMGEVGLRLGMVHPGQGTSTVRTVFLIDPKGVVRIILYYPKEIGRSIDEILRALKALQVCDAEGVALPEGWPNNELIGDKVIISPAATVEDAEARADKEGCYDWWFCTKKL